MLYNYKVKDILKVYDGDTITVILDLGFGINKIEKIRLLYINAPEIKGSERPLGLKSKKFLKNILLNAILEKKNIIIKTKKDRKGKYGRYLGEIFVDNISINKLMITEGYAKKY